MRTLPGSLQEFKARLFRALSHEARVRILEALTEGDCSVGELQARLSLPGPNVSQHLAILRDQGIVDTRRDGTCVIYHLAEPLISSLLGDARAIFERRITQGAALLEEPHDRPVVQGRAAPGIPRIQE